MSIYTPKQIKELFLQKNLRPKKMMGQNFLIDKKALSAMVATAELTADDIVLEIGPGLGGLTVALAQRVKKVMAIERDKQLIELLRENIASEKLNDKVEIVAGDILELPMTNDQLQNYKLISNLPYEISSPVLWKFLYEETASPQLMVLMLQKEVAEKITARPGAMSLLSVLGQFYAKVALVAKVSKSSFWPAPKVDSAIVRFNVGVGFKLALPDGFNERGFFKMVKAGFSSPRKKLINNLISFRPTEVRSLTKAGLEGVFKKINLDFGIRAEDLSVENWIDIYRSF